ncbi:MAG: hypothetical protein LiPW41_539 [Parcubacteria group bacterium LiPW_41]|nr:MAG: hypothetical protein LiPW41_539 [Parcubacteria group bacterium LiPW_41]
MFAIILALFYGAYLYVISGSPAEIVYISSTGFLYHWYLVWSIVLGIVVILFTSLVTLGFTIIGGMTDRKIGTFIGFLCGGAVSFYATIKFIIRRILYTGGAYMLSIALFVKNGAYMWDYVLLGLGAAFIVIAVFTKKHRKASVKFKESKQK